MTDVKVDAKSVGQGAATDIFWSTYDDVMEAKKVVDEWRGNHLDKFGAELEFDREYYLAKVVPHLTGLGVFTSEVNLVPQGFSFDTGRPVSGLRLSAKVYAVIAGFGGLYKYGDKVRFSNDCMNRRPAVGGLTYNPKLLDVPQELRPKFDEMMMAYAGVQEFLRNYDEVELDGPGWDKPLPEKLGEEEYRIHLLDVSATKYAAAVTVSEDDVCGGSLAGKYQ